MLIFGLLVTCGSTEPGRSFEGTWVLQSVNGTPLPFNYSYTTTDSQFVPRLPLADTLTLASVSTERLWFDAGSGPQVEEDHVFLTEFDGDSFVIHLVETLDVQRHAILDDSHLRVRIPDGRVRAGLYDFVHLNAP